MKGLKGVIFFVFFSIRLFAARAHLEVERATLHQTLNLSASSASASQPPEL
jgi:hypothetical protein